MALNSDEKRIILLELMQVQDNKCYYCGKVCFIGTLEQRINKDRYYYIATIEHLLPKGWINRNNKKNLAMACNKCNNERSNLTNKLK